VALLVRHRRLRSEAKRRALFGALQLSAMGEGGRRGSGDGALFAVANPLLGSKGATALSLATDKLEADVERAQELAKKSAGQATLAAKRLAKKDAEVVRLTALLQGRRDKEIELLCRAVAARAAGLQEFEEAAGAELPGAAVAVTASAAQAGASGPAPVVLPASAEVAAPSIDTASAASVGAAEAGAASAKEPASKTAPANATASAVAELAPSALQTPAEEKGTNALEAAQIAAAKEPPPPWEKAWSSSKGKVYYFNPADGRRSWTCPK